METTNQCNEKSFYYVISVSNIDTNGNLIPGSSYVSIKNLPCEPPRNMESLKNDSDKACDQACINPNRSRSVEKLCILFFKDHDKLGIAGMTLEQIQMHAIAQAVLKYKGNYAQAARKLGLCAKTVYTKLKKCRRSFAQDRASNKIPQFIMREDMDQTVTGHSPQLFQMTVTASWFLRGIEKAKLPLAKE